MLQQTPEKDQSEKDPETPTSVSESEYQRRIQKLADDWARVEAKLGLPPYDPDAPTTLATDGILTFSTQEEEREFWRKRDEEQQERQARLRKNNDQK